MAVRKLHFRGPTVDRYTVGHSDRSYTRSNCTGLNSRIAERSFEEGN